MRITMTRHLVATGLDFLYQMRMSIRDPAKDEEGGPGRPWAVSVVGCPWSVASVEKVQDEMGVAFHSGFEGIPLLRVDNVGKGMDLEVILDVDGQGVDHEIRDQGARCKAQGTRDTIVMLVLSVRAFDHAVQRGSLEAFEAKQRRGVQGERRSKRSIAMLVLSLPGGKLVRNDRNGPTV